MELKDLELQRLQNHCFYTGHLASVILFSLYKHKKSMVLKKLLLTHIFKRKHAFREYLRITSFIMKCIKQVYKVNGGSWQQNCTVIVEIRKMRTFFERLVSKNATTWLLVKPLSVLFQCDSEKIQYTLVCYKSLLRFQRTEDQVSIVYEKRVQFLTDVYLV